ILDKEDRFVLLADRKRRWMRALLVRVRQGKAGVVGGPHRLSYPKDKKGPGKAPATLEEGEEGEGVPPDPPPKKKPKDSLHGGRLLGKATVKDATMRKNLAAALVKGAEESNGELAACFNPRHGIRATHDGKTAEFVICFECLQVRVYVGRKGDE